MAKIIWTKVDEAPALATYSLLPIVKAFVKEANANLEVRDISLAGRILAKFSDRLPKEKKVNDDLAYLEELVLKPEANIIKLPNISASLPQLVAAIKELQSQGYNIPDYPENPQNEEEKEIKAIYDSCVGSVVNPILRQGNSDRRIAKPVKKYARKHPHSMKPVEIDSQTYVAHMKSGDFYDNEQSVTMPKATKIRFEFVDKNSNVTCLKELDVEKDEVIDATVLNRKKLKEFYELAIEDAKDNNILFSLHLKATMMKVSDPAMFGDAIRVYYKELFDKYSKELEEIGFNPNRGLSDLEERLKKLPQEKQEEIKSAIKEIYKKRPDMYMVDSDKGITNLHRPNNVIIDASIPATIKNGLKGWGFDGSTKDCVIAVPDRSYATMYKEIVEDIKLNGQFDPTRVGSVANVGLMAKKAEEYGSHDKTFFAPGDGKIRVVDEDGNALMEVDVEKDDIFRGCQVKDDVVKDWVKLAVNRAKESGEPIVFWLDSYRAHDREIIKKVKDELKNYDLSDVEYYIKAPEDAMKFTLKRFRNGDDTISVTGNILRDYLTDLFPIIEVGTSARSLSIVPLLAGGGVFETGAGGSAPKHVAQFLNEGHLRWDSLGEFLALAESLRLSKKQGADKKIEIIANALDNAISRYLENDKTPKRKVKELDNRGSHFYLAKYWAEALSQQKEDKELADKFSKVAKELNENEEKIISEIFATEGKPQDIGGYYHLNDEKATKAMRPSETFNKIIESI